MIEYANAQITRLIVHKIGCKAEGEELHLSKGQLDVGEYESMSDVLKPYFFKPFKSDQYFNFSDRGEDNGLDMNMVYTQVAAVFDDPATFYEQSVNIAELLFDCSNHPKIKGGELYLAYFAGCVVDGQICDAVGIFKSENKEMFLKVYLSENDRIELGAQEGVSIRKLDKGCIVFNIEREEGFRVVAVDNINRGQEAQFWMEDFLGLKPREDSHFFTDNYMQMCKGFVRDVFNDEHQITRPEQIDLMNKSLDFFQKNKVFSEEAFNANVMSDPQVIQAFDEYKQQYQTDSRFTQQIPSEFEISADAVKGEKKHFKSVIKLDKNFHVYVHGGRYYMEKGYDRERDMNYYKLFYKSES
ncbi:MAG: nucleoid-associated protein [Bacteroidales bacterium]|nr:nucleoid-associated protein [Bacteroidales bacterium]